MAGNLLLTYSLAHSTAAVLNLTPTLILALTLTVTVTLILTVTLTLTLSSWTGGAKVPTRTQPRTLSRTLTLILTLTLTLTRYLIELGQHPGRTLMTMHSYRDKNATLEA